jgi:hypothetical protein
MGKEYLPSCTIMSNRTGGIERRANTLKININKNISTWNEINKKHQISEKRRLGWLGSKITK